MQLFRKLLGLPDARRGAGATPALPGRRGTNPLDDTLIDFGHGDRWTVRDACEGTQIFGAIGSGKTSGSGQAIAEAFLKAGFGGLVLTAKPGEHRDWKGYMRRAGRDPSDLIDFSPGSGHRFNFLEYERLQGGLGGGYSRNLVSLFFAIAESEEHGKEGGKDQAFWKNAVERLLRNTIDLLLLADEPLTMGNIHALISTAPEALPYEWAGSFYDKCINRAHEKTVADPRTFLEDYTLVHEYWTKKYPTLVPETRLSVLTTFDGIADKFMSAPLRDLFCKDHSTVTPEDTQRGKVIVVNLPIKEYKEVGKLAQTLFKYCWQRATEREQSAPRQPVFLWADESQFFINSYDMHFQTTARSSMAATVYLSQNLPNYYALLSAGKGKHEADSLLGNFQTKIFHSNTDNVTNQWAADLIGKAWTTKIDRSSGRTRQEPGAGARQATSTSQHNVSRQSINEYQVPPVRFTTLKKGGPPNQGQVEAVICQGGRTWSHGKNHATVTFHQKPLEEA